MPPRKSTSSRRVHPGAPRGSRRATRRYTEERLREACEVYEALGELGTYRSVGDHFGIPWKTLQARHRALRSSRSESHASAQLLSPEEEDALCDWLEHLSHTGFPVDKRTVLDLVQQITGACRPPNEKWVYRFLQRHPTLQLGRPSGLDPRRAQAFNPPVVEDYFKKLEGMIKKNNIPWSHVYNMDEKGIQRGGGRRLQSIKYFVPRGQRTNYKLRSASLELVTIIECVSADGGNIMPGFVFAGQEFLEEWFKNVDPRITVAKSPNGWTDDFVCTEWFTKCFMPQAEARRESDAPILLIVDGHGSHVTEEMRKLAINNNIEIICLPAHTTHRLQPLDVGIFGPLQHAWTKRCNEYYVASRGEEMDRGRLIQEYMAVRNQVFTPSLVKKAWYSSGVTSETWSASFFPPSAFATSYATSTRTHVPPSYPTSGNINNLPPEERPVLHEERTDDDIQSLFGTDLDSTTANSDLDADADMQDANSDTDSNLDLDSDSDSDSGTSDTNMSDEEVTSHSHPPSRSHSHSHSHSHPHSHLHLPSSSLSHSRSPSPSLSHSHSPSPSCLRSHSHSHSHSHSQSRSASTSASDRMDFNTTLDGPSSSEHIRRRGTATSSSTVSTFGRRKSGVKPPPPTYNELLRENEALRKENRTLRTQKKHAEAHAAIAHWHIGGLTTQLNLKNARKGRGRRRTLKTHARCITAGAGALECEREEAERREKAARKEQARQQKENEEAARAIERERLAADPTHIFSGALARKVKHELKLIALALRLPIEAKKTKSQIAELITAHLQASADRYAADPRFAGLYSTANGLASYQKQTQTPSANQNEIPPPDALEHIRLDSHLATDPLTTSMSTVPNSDGWHTLSPFYDPLPASAPPLEMPSGGWHSPPPQVSYSPPGPSTHPFPIPTHTHTPVTPSPSLLPIVQRMMLGDLPPVQYANNTPFHFNPFLPRPSYFSRPA